MKTVKKTPKKQLENYSTLFTQLGLVLVLFITYVVLEYEIEKEVITNSNLYDPSTRTYAFDQPLITYRKEIVKEKTKPLKKKILIKLPLLTKVDNTHEVIEKIINEPNEEDKTVANANDLVTVYEGDDISEDDEPINFTSLEEAPVFKGCEGLSPKENKKCFEKKIAKLIQRNFDSGLAQDIGLEPRRHRIFTEFIINEEGAIVNLKIRAPHKRLEKETQRIIKKIPQFAPGKQQGVPVKVRYRLPITFLVE
ncbi:energy transducer TonB [Tenacibaculum maritimum]|uniref:energy transducer TonB n=1 Tax=Tenacibaculum maritimum TaxID=107401 RepID=UPI003875CA6D